MDFNLERGLKPRPRANISIEPTTAQIKRQNYIRGLDETQSTKTQQNKELPSESIKIVRAFRTKHRPKKIKEAASGYRSAESEFVWTFLEEQQVDLLLNIFPFDFWL